MRFASRIAIVTGAGNGIGRAAALLLAREGAHVVAVDIAEEALRRVARGIEAENGVCMPIQADILDAADVGRLVTLVVERFGRIDILINAVGGSTAIARPGAGIEEISLDEWEVLLAFNLRGTFLCISAVVPHMKQQGRGAIINLSSIVARGDHVASRTNAPYVLAKGGLQAFTRKLAQELGPCGIRCNATSPGVTRTERIEALLAQRTPEERESMTEAVPLRRLATPEDIAKVIAFLASDDAGFVSGQTIEVTGGQ